MCFEDIIKIENVYQAWLDFSKGKMKKQDVQFFAANLEDELISIWRDLSTGSYVHESYSRFIVHDPKRRVIHKAAVRDRIVHRLVYNTLFPAFHCRWLDCSFSCRPGLGQHRSIHAVHRALRQATKNWSRECWVLKCDVQKFFDSVDHTILFSLLSRNVYDCRLSALLKVIIESYSTQAGRGLPIGNLTSQLFANVYLHELDRHIKHDLKLRHYVRYADDFLAICQTKKDATDLIVPIASCLENKLKLRLHPKKIIIRKTSWGIDWLGHVLFSDHQVLRPSTRQRMMRHIHSHDTLASYNGLLIGTARRELDKRLLQSFCFLL
ncbi:group II intron reverse transcriptase domain-containing protein [Candidatus Uhrbacteria bacterium]|nr:group II intron reverse transcriptase domain-containing protein [Candidatus Uhrbacteria bacterium]